MCVCVCVCVCGGVDVWMCVHYGNFNLFLFNIYIMFMILSVPQQVQQQQQPVIQQCSLAAACASCVDSNTVVVQNGQIVTTNIRRVLRNRFDNDASATNVPLDACCPNCQPIIGDANVIGAGTTTATCSITCDYNNNNQNSFNLNSFGNVGTFNPGLNFNALSALSSLGTGFNGLSGLGSIGGLGGLGG